jgi:hypothetical protein
LDESLLGILQHTDQVWEQVKRHGHPFHSCHGIPPPYRTPVDSHIDMQCSPDLPERNVNIFQLRATYLTQFLLHGLPAMVECPSVLLTQSRQ